MRGAGDGRGSVRRRRAASGGGEQPCFASRLARRPRSAAPAPGSARCRPTPMPRSRARPARSLAPRSAPGRTAVQRRKVENGTQAGEDGGHAHGAARAARRVEAQQRAVAAARAREDEAAVDVGEACGHRGQRTQAQQLEPRVCALGQHREQQQRAARVADEVPPRVDARPADGAQPRIVVRDARRLCRGGGGGGVGGGGRAGGRAGARGWGGGGGR